MEAECEEDALFGNITELSLSEIIRIIREHNVDYVTGRANAAESEVLSEDGLPPLPPPAPVALRCCKSLLLLMLLRWDELMRELNMTYVISYGTLLGAVRDERIIPWTSDVDVALSMAEVAQLSQSNVTKEMEVVHQRLWDEGWLYFVQACGRFCMRRGVFSFPVFFVQTLYKLYNFPYIKPIFVSLIGQI
jgi:hypothetical protein